MFNEVKAVTTFEKILSSSLLPKKGTGQVSESDIKRANDLTFVRTPHRFSFISIPVPSLDYFPNPQNISGRQLSLIRPCSGALSGNTQFLDGGS